MITIDGTVYFFIAVIVLAAQPAFRSCLHPAFVELRDVLKVHYVPGFLEPMRRAKTRMKMSINGTKYYILLCADPRFYMAVVYPARKATA